MGLIKNKIIKNLKIKLWIRYVDDVYAIITEEDKLDKILRGLNEIHKSMQFTLEIEINGALNSLGVTIKKVENKITATVYRKLNSSIETTSINSRCNTPFQYKLAVTGSYINRTILICSNEQLLKKEIKFIIDIAENTGYKKTLVKNIYSKYQNQFYKIQSALKEKRKITIPF